MIPKPQNINEFSKLFKIHIPSHEHWDYYIQTLLKSPEYEDLLDKVINFVEFEGTVKSVREAKLSHSNNLILKIRESRACQRIQDYEVPQLRYGMKCDNLKTHSLGCPYFISYDIPKANYHVLKHFDDENAFPDTWEEFCYQQSVPYILSKSKMFRQIVFGNANPRKFQRIQSEFVDDLIMAVGVNIDPGLVEPSFKSADELIQRYKNEPLQLQLDKTPKHGIFKLTPFEFSHIEKDYYIKTIYNMRGYQEYKTLYGVPGSMFYMYFKKHILNGPLDDRDLLFWTEKRLARWVV